MLHLPTQRALAAPRRLPPVRHPLPDPRLVCPAGHGLMLWDPVFRRLTCLGCPAPLWLAPAQARTLEAIRAGQGPGCSAASFLAELVLRDQGVPPVGDPR